MTPVSPFYVEVAIYSQVISAFLFMGVLVWLWFKFILPAVLAAQARTNASIADAEAHRDEAKATLDTLKTEINGASRDSKLIHERAAAQAQHEYDAAIAEAQQAGDRALRNAQGELDRARAAARERLRDEMLSKALERAREEATRRIDEPTNTRLVDRFVSSLERN